MQLFVRIYSANLKVNCYFASALFPLSRCIQPALTSAGAPSPQPDALTCRIGRARLVPEEVFAFPVLASRIGRLIRALGAGAG
jgi:hypothetical protein